MPEIVISDTSCLILLTKINELDLLRTCYKKIIVPEEVAQEYGSSLPDWIEIRQASQNSLQKTLQQIVDRGEAGAFALALEIPDTLVIVDDRKARKVALSLGLTVTGTLGVFVKAKRLGLIPSVKPILAKLAGTDFRISERIVTTILELTGEK
jgi:predicted nucleic acid-binding protein